MSDETCYIVHQFDAYNKWRHYCSACGHRISGIDYDYERDVTTNRPDHCPWCGRRVGGKYA